MNALRQLAQRLTGWQLGTLAPSRPRQGCAAIVLAPGAVDPTPVLVVCEVASARVMAADSKAAFEYLQGLGRRFDLAFSQ